MAKKKDDKASKGRKAAVRLSTKGQLAKVRKAKKQSKLKRRLREIFLGKEAYLPESRKKKPSPKKLEKKTKKRMDTAFKSKRTAATERKLKKAGLTKKELRKLRD